MLEFTQEEIASIIAHTLVTGEETSSVKFYELPHAIALCKFFELQYGKPCKISFELERPDKVTSKSSNAQELIAVLEGRVRQGSEIDIGITFEGKMVKPFQFKRYGFKNRNVSCQDLADTINGLKKEYGTKKLNVGLLIILQNEVRLDVDGLQDKLEMTDFPFNKVMFTHLKSIENPDTEDEEIFLEMGEFWPDWGCNQYKISKGELQKLDT